MQFRRGKAQAAVAVTGAVVALLLISGCGGSGSTYASEETTTPLPDVGHVPQVVYRKIVGGARKDLREANASLDFQRCFLDRLRDELSSETIALLIVRSDRDGRAGAARALNHVAAPIGASCGATSQVPELLHAVSLFPFGTLLNNQPA